MPLPGAKPQCSHPDRGACVLSPRQQQTTHNSAGSSCCNPVTTRHLTVACGHWNQFGCPVSRCVRWRHLPTSSRHRNTVIHRGTCTANSGASALNLARLQCWAPPTHNQHTRFQKESKTPKLNVALSVADTRASPASSRTATRLAMRVHAVNVFFTRYSKEAHTNDAIVVIRICPGTAA